LERRIFAPFSPAAQADVKVSAFRSREYRIAVYLHDARKLVGHPGEA
jgi:hypothetical protein